MLKRRLIPKLLIKQRGTAGRPVVVATRRFGEAVEVGEPVSVAKVLEAQAADEILLLDIDATLQGRRLEREVLTRVGEAVFMPITAGGGVTSLDDFQELLRSGADKVSVNSAAVERPQLIERASRRFGAQCVVVSIDARRSEDEGYRVFVRSGRQPTGLDPVEWAVECERRGAGEILITSIDRDGTRAGLDVELARRIVAAVGVPVVASGGCGKAHHLVEGFTEAGVDGVAAGTFFCFQDQNIMQARAHVRNAGVPIRLQR